MQDQADLAGDISDTAMLRSTVDAKRCVFTEPKRLDETLVAWLSTVGAGGWRWQLPLAEPTGRLLGFVRQQPGFLHR